MFSNEEILRIAMQQSAWDINAGVEDFTRDENVLVDLKIGDRAKNYYEKGVACNFISYGSNLVAAAKPEYREMVKEYIDKYEFYHCFETPNMHWLDERMKEKGMRVCFMAEYFLPDMKRLVPLSCPYGLKVLGPEDFKELYVPKWSNALSGEKRRHLDVLGVGAYDQDKLIGLAACSADAEDMWQIGVDVLPKYRKQGVAAALTSNLAIEILKHNKVPFYCCAWSNLRSAKNAIKSGFTPGWAEMTVTPKELVEKMNK